MGSGEGGGGFRRGARSLWLLMGLLALLGAVIAGYLLGRSSGEDVNHARNEGRVAGERSGSARGAETGYRRGLRAGRRDGFREGYRRALAGAAGTGQGQAPAVPIRRSCGDIAEEGAGTYNVQSVNVICDIALQVARQWEMECAQRPSGDCTVRAGFACDYQQTGYELGSIACSDGDRRVTFATGA